MTANTNNKYNDCIYLLATFRKITKLIQFTCNTRSFSSQTVNRFFVQSRTKLLGKSRSWSFTTSHTREFHFYCLAISSIRPVYCCLKIFCLSVCMIHHHSYMQEKENVKPLKELTHLLTGSIVLAFTLFRSCHFPPTPSQKMHNMPEKFENAALCNFPARMPEFYADTNLKWSVIVAFSNFSDVEDRAETRLRMSLIRAGKPGNI